MDPVRPPRGVKGPKESTGLLMSVIRTLSVSQNNAVRDREKAKLEKEYKRSDQRLDDLVSAHQDELADTMQHFSKISTRVTTSREKLKSVRENLVTCKKLLHCKREELKKLWLEAVEHKQVLYLLKEIEGLLEVPEKLESYMQKKHYLHATQLLVNSVSLLENSLESVEALSELKVKLNSRKEQLFKVLVDDLHKHLYVRSTNGVLKQFRRQGSDRQHSDGIPGTPRKASRIENAPLPQLYKLSGIVPSAEETINHVVEDVAASDPEENSYYFIGIIIECLALLNKIPETVEIIKERSQRELLAITRRTAQQVLDNAQNISAPSSQFPLNSIHSQGQSYLLLELLELVFEQFRCVASAHYCVLVNLKRIAGSQGDHSGEIHLYEMADVWFKIQSAMEIWISYYLDIQNTVASQQPTPAFNDVTSDSDIISFFGKKRNVKNKNFSLFRFDSSSHAISMNIYLQEQKEAMREKGEIDAMDTEERFPVCQPSTKNITVIFKPMMKFIGEIEEALHLETDTRCLLHEFLSKCVQVYFGQVVKADVEATIDRATKSLDAWKIITDPEVLKALGVIRPILQSVVDIDRSVQEYRALINAVPMYADHYLNAIIKILQNYKDTCNTAYRGLIQPESEDKRVISATWAKDQDINRFLRSLPNWENLEKLKGDCKAVDIEESPQEVQQRTKKESEVLTEIMTGETLIPQHEILPDVGQLHILAELQESLEWFTNHFYSFLKSLPHDEDDDEDKQATLTLPVRATQTSTALESDIPPVPQGTFKSFVKLYKEFEDLANTCLLVLHLEVRVHCFYYLLPVAIHGSFAKNIESQEPDDEIVKLNKDLSSIDEALAASLQPRKLKYIFEGLGHLVASILINSTSRITKINSNGVKKMCCNIFALQQNLTGITMSREVALDHARQYFELFYHSADDILNLIVEHGAQFQALEYMSALQLLHRSQEESNPTKLNDQLERLQELLNTVAVTI